MMTRKQHTNNNRISKLMEWASVATIAGLLLTVFGEVVCQIEVDTSRDRGTFVNIPNVFRMGERQRQSDTDDGNYNRNYNYNKRNDDINILSGLVRIERDRNASTSWGRRRPISVSVFGIPVYQRGNSNSSFGNGNGEGLFGDGGIFGSNGLGGIFGNGNGVRGIFGNGGGDSGGDSSDDEPLPLDP